jgi:hypothetical protein
MRKTLLANLSACVAAPVLAAAPASDTEPAVRVQFGKPTFEQTLYYEKLYEEKPFPDATLYYYDNGVYKIISPGEEHYGVYVVQGRLSDDAFAVHYISLPSSDWGGKTAHHYLRFDRRAGGFTQQATWEDDGSIPPQHGRFSQGPNVIADPRSIKWETHADDAQRNR